MNMTCKEIHEDGSEVDHPERCPSPGRCNRGPLPLLLPSGDHVTTFYCSRCPHNCSENEVDPIVDKMKEYMQELGMLPPDRPQQPRREVDRRSYTGQPEEMMEPRNLPPPPPPNNPIQTFIDMLLDREPGDDSSEKWEEGMLNGIDLPNGDIWFPPVLPRIPEYVQRTIAEFMGMGNDRPFSDFHGEGMLEREANNEPPSPLHPVCPHRRPHHHRRPEEEVILSQK